MSNTKAVLGVLEGVMQIPKDSQKTSLDFMAYVMKSGKGIVDVISDEQSRKALLVTIDRMASLQPEDRDEVCRFLSSTVQPVPTVVTTQRLGRDLREEPFIEGTTSIPTKGHGMMEKARTFLGSLPTGTTVSPISIVKRAGINPANMYQFCKSLAKQGFLHRVSAAKYKTTASPSVPPQMDLIRQVASMGKLTPRTYIEKLPAQTPFKIGLVKDTCKVPWNHVTAYVHTLMKKGLIKRTARGVYVKVK